MYFLFSFTCPRPSHPTIGILLWAFEVLVGPEVRFGRKRFLQYYYNLVYSCMYFFFLICSFFQKSLYKNYSLKQSTKHHYLTVFLSIFHIKKRRLRNCLLQQLFFLASLFNLHCIRWDVWLIFVLSDDWFFSGAYFVSEKFMYQVRNTTAVLHSVCWLIMFDFVFFLWTFGILLVFRY